MISLNPISVDVIGARFLLPAGNPRPPALSRTRPRNPDEFSALVVGLVRPFVVVVTEVRGSANGQGVHTPTLTHAPHSSTT